MSEYKKISQFNELERREHDSLIAEQVYLLDQRSELEAKLIELDKYLADFNKRYEEFLKTIEVTPVAKD